MRSSIAFIGAGPTAIYALHALVTHATTRFDVTIFEKQSVAGRGTPYRPGWNDPAMLANIASIELPPLVESLVEWLERQSADHLRTFGIDHRDIDDQAFYPRLALGEYLRDQFDAIVERGRSKGIAIDVRTRTEVVDARNEEDGIVLTVVPHAAANFDNCFEHVVMATGHQWPSDPEVRPGFFSSPWPASVLARIPACRIGIRGASLTAIDAAVALALEHGRFDTSPGKDLVYRPNQDSRQFHLTMMSRKGLLPEADFYHPIPYEPLAVCTKGAIKRLIAEKPDDLLDRAFTLFKQEIEIDDPAYAAKIGLEGIRLEEFAERFFADRLSTDPFEWAERNLAEARRNMDAGITVNWRYAILRMHEVIELIVPHLDDAAFARFSHYWKPIFVDDYATVPHESIERMLALHRAKALDILQLGDDYTLDSHAHPSGAVVTLSNKAIHFPVFIEATGQHALEARDFPFPTLRDQGIIRDEPTSSEAIPPRGLAIDDEFHPVSEAIPDGRLYCLSLPFILGRHPFSQGITSSRDMGEVVGRELADRMATSANGNGSSSGIQKEDA